MQKKITKIASTVVWGAIFIASTSYADLGDQLQKNSADAAIAGGKQAPGGSRTMAAPQRASAPPQRVAPPAQQQQRPTPPPQQQQRPPPPPQQQQRPTPPPQQQQRPTPPPSTTPPPANNQPAHNTTPPPSTTPPPANNQPAHNTTPPPSMTPPSQQQPQHNTTPPPSTTPPAQHQPPPATAPKPPVTPPRPPPPPPPQFSAPPVKLNPQQQQQKQNEVKQNLQNQTDQARKIAPPNVQIKPTDNAKPMNNGQALLVRSNNPAVGTTVYNKQTGAPVAAYTRNTGAPVSAPPVGIRPQPRPGGGTILTAPGYSRTEDGHGNNVTNVRGTTINERVVNNTVIVNRSVTIRGFNNGQPFAIHPERSFVRTPDRYHGGYVNLFRPNWWGLAAFMTTAWVLEGTGIYPYGVYFGGRAFGVFITPWYPTGGFVNWADHPYGCYGPCWDGYYTRWGWGYHSDPYFTRYYVGYYTPIYTYRHMGYWIADYWLQRELETERLERLAAYQDLAFYQAEQAEWNLNAEALTSSYEPQPPSLMDTLALQTQDIVASIQAGEGHELFASQEVDAGHIFAVDTHLSETTVINGRTHNCSLRAGDLIKPDPNVEQDVEPILDSNNNPIVDEYGNAESVTYVTMDVVRSKMFSCRKGSQVVVQMSTLETMFADEKARVMEGMEQSIKLGVQP